MAKQPDSQQIAFLEQFKLQDFQIKKLQAEKDKLTRMVQELKQQVAKLTADNEKLRQGGGAPAAPAPAAPTTPAPVGAAPAAPPAAPAPAAVNGEQVVGVIEAWMNSRSPLENQRVIWFTNVDKELSLPAGASRSYLAKAAEKCGYKVLRQSAGTILLQQG